jgi:hypothetical protein
MYIQCAIDNCDNTFTTQSKRGSRQKYCSPECKNKRDMDVRGVAAKEVVVKVCALDSCDNKFSTVRSRGTVKTFCSDYCRGKQNTLRNQARYAMTYKSTRPKPEKKTKKDLRQATRRTVVAYAEPRTKVCCCQKKWDAIYLHEIYCPTCYKDLEAQDTSHQKGDDDSHLHPQTGV